LSVAAVTGQNAQQDGSVEVAKYVDIQPSEENTTLKALRRYRTAASAEDGNARVLVLEEAGRPSRFLIVEKWKDVPASMNRYQGSTG
jgi:quinol monooxygenase YgiN